MLQVGAAAATIPVLVGEPLAGYALRTSVCTGSHDPLRARVVLVDDGASAAALVVLDLLYAPATLDAEVRAAVARAAGLDPGAVMVSATHTHAAPAGLATDGDIRHRVTTAARDAATAARAAALPAVLGIATRRVPGISANRRSPAGRPDDRAQILVARSADGGRTIATVVAFACHATVLDHTVTDASADFPGALCRRLEQQVGGTAVYLQGAAGDVNPVFTHSSHHECERIGGVLAAAATGVVLEVAGRQAGLRTISPTWQREFAADHLADCRVIDEPRITVGWAHADADPEPPLPPAAEIARARAALPGQPGAEDARLWIRQLRAAEPNLFGVLDVPPPARIRVQRIGFGPDLAVLALPGEPFTATAAALRERAAGDLIVAGYAHQSVGYLPPAAEWAVGGYEVGCCPYAESVESKLRSAALALVRPDRDDRTR